MSKENVTIDQLVVSRENFRKDCVISVGFKMFIPLHQAKAPKYDVYSIRESETSDSTDPGLRVKLRGRHAPAAASSAEEDISSPSENAPVHSTPVSTGVPPLAHAASAVTSASSAASQRTRLPAAAAAGGGGSSRRPAGAVSGRSSTDTSSSTAAGVRSVPGLSLGREARDTLTSYDASIFSQTELWTSSSSQGSRSSRRPREHHISTTATSTTLASPSTALPAPNTTALASNRPRTPASAGGSGPSKASGSGRSRTPGSGRSRTPGSATSRTSHALQEAQELPPSTIVAVVEGRGQARGEVGVAAIDLRCPQLSLAQFSDTHTYTRTLTKLTILNPLEVVVATTAVRAENEGGRGCGGLVRVLQECLTEASVTAVQRRYFNDTRGLAVVRHLAAPHCAYVERHVAAKYYCLAAVAAVMKYVEHIQHVTYAPHSLHICLTSSENTMSIDYSSCRKLELVRSLRGGWEESLFASLRHTRTPGGTRLLRASLLQPHADSASISARLDALQYLVEHPDLFYTLQSILGRFPDVDWLLSMCVQMPKEDTEQRCELRLNYVIALKNTLELLDPLAKALHDVADPMLASVREAVSSAELGRLQELLRQVLHEDARLVKGAAAMRTQRCYAIKSNVNGLLDVARKIYSEIIDDITEQVEALGREHGLYLRLGHNAARGFHITHPLFKRTPPPRLPSVFIQVQRGRGCITCTTEQVYQLDQRSRDTLREILIMSNVIVLEMLVEARGRMGALHGLGEAVATLDLLVGLTHGATLRSWVRPEFSHALAIRGGRHPILDVLANTPPVPNNTFLSPENRVMVVTGPNMSGKSTYLRQIALIQVLAQIGSFVPAEFASLRLVNQLFTHLGSEDAPESNASTFQVQMSDVTHMVSGADRDSLVLLDELGSGTSLEEGGALAWAVMEALISARATTVLATHALFLTRLAALYPTVANYHLESEHAGEGRLRLTHVVRKGVTQATHYGLALAAVTSIPPSVLRRAKGLALTMTPPTQMGREDDSEGVRQRAVYHLAHRLLALAQAALPASSSDTSLPTPVITPPDSRDRETNTMEASSTTSSAGLQHSIEADGRPTFLASRGNQSASDEVSVAGGEAVAAAPPAAAAGRDEELRDQLKTLLQEFMERVVHPEGPTAQDDSISPAQGNDE